MERKRMEMLLQECIEYIIESVDCPKLVLHCVVGFTDNELNELGYDWLTENNEEES